MNRPSVRRSARTGVAAALLVATLVDGCGHRDPPGPPGSTPRPVVPTSRQQAQDTALGYLEKTLQGLPAGTTLDATRYSGGTNAPPCEDVVNGVPPVAFTTIGDLKLPAGVDPDDIIAKVGALWQGWGWHVVDRGDSVRKSRFGYAPDGYRLHIMAAAKPSYPPSVESISPCFPGDLPDHRSPFPMVLTAR